MIKTICTCDVCRKETDKHYTIKVSQSLQGKNYNYEDIHICDKCVLDSSIKISKNETMMLDPFYGINWIKRALMLDGK